MKIKQALYLGVAAAALASGLVMPSSLWAQTAAVVMDSDDIGGVVAGPNGPEAGVWVIANPMISPTKLAKIVVTDGQGRYVIRICPRRIIPCRCVATGWSIRPSRQPRPASW